MFYRINLQYLPSGQTGYSVVIEPPYAQARKADEYIVYLIKKGVMYLEWKTEKR